jgi:hypothetical protein
MLDGATNDAEVPRLRDGSEWADHEDCIVGNEAGLRKLIAACEQALSQGKYYGSDLGDYVGVKKLDSEWFKDLAESRQTRIGSFVIGMALLVLLSLTLVGAGTVVRWMF